MAMLTSLVVALVLAAAPTAPEAPGAGPADPLLADIAAVRAAGHARDSVAVIADTTQGAHREILEESIWQRHIEFNDRILAVTQRIAEHEAAGREVAVLRRSLEKTVDDDWPRFLIQLRRWQRTLTDLSTAADAASGAERMALESRATQQSERLLDVYRSLLDVLQALDKVKIDVSAQRAALIKGLPPAAEKLLARVHLANRERAAAVARLSREPSSADLRYASEASEERFKRATASLSTAIGLMDRLGLEDTPLRVALISETGRMTADVFQGKVLVGLLKLWWSRAVDFVVLKAPQWLFQGLLITITFFGFRALSKLVGRTVRRAVQHSTLSGLMRSTIVRLSSTTVMLIGYVVILTQLGVQVAPVLAGFGIAGVVVGFALQNTLSNFAAGGMILSNQPFDVGDEIEVAGVVGTVKRMTLVSTTILTGDNQTLIVPNSAVWGGVIRNRTTQPFRRVDLMFGIDYQDDIDKAERALREVVTAHEQVRKDPAPVIRLHQLADSSVNFVVRVWTTREQYWEVYWDLTRAVKLRFDAEGITIPFPQRQVHLEVTPGSEGVLPGGTPRREG
jgi:small conductance mechanosensitive channel